MFLVSMADIIGSYERLPNDAVRAVAVAQRREYFRMDFLMGCLRRLQCGVPTRFILIHLEIVAGHAVTAVGYDDFKECFIVA